MNKYQPAPLEYNTFSRMELFPVHFGEIKVIIKFMQNGWGTEVRIRDLPSKKLKDNK